jgi:hypothetical protein
VVALPHELDGAGRRQLAEDFARPIAERHGIAAQVSIHAPDKEGDQRNHHAHILFTHREYSPDGFGDVSNARAVMKKNKKGVFKETMIYGIAANPADIIALRKEWEQTVNRAYERAGLDIRVDHRSHEDRGIGQEPTKHLGPTANEMEKRGEPSDRGNVNREITQRNAEARALAALEAEARNVSGQIIDLKAELAMQEARAAAVGRYDRLDETHQQVARDQFSARYDDLRAAEPPPEVVRVFDASANRTAEPAAPVYDRDSDNALWEKNLAEAAIAAQEARQQPGASAGRETRGGGPEPSGGPAARPEPEDMRPLGKVAGEIRIAWTLSRTAEELEEALAAKGISLAEVSPEEAQQSQRTAAFAKEVGNYARVLREKEIVAVDQFGGVHRFDQRTTGDLRPEIEARFDGFAGIDRAGLLNVTDAKEAMQEASREIWRAERQAEREQARPASWMEQRIAECAEAARTEGATIQQDRDGKRVGGTEALADSLRPEGQRETKEVKVYGTEAFAALLEDAGIAIARVTEPDTRVLDSWREELAKDRMLSAATDEIYQGNRLDEVLIGDLAAVARNGDVHRINPEKLGDAPRHIGDDLPGVIETQAKFKVERAATADIWTELKTANAEDRSASTAAFEGDRALHRHAAAAEHGVEKTFEAAADAIEATTGFGKRTLAILESALSGFFSFFGGGGPKLTQQQQHDRAQAQDGNLEADHARGYAASEQQNEAERDGRIFELVRQQQQKQQREEMGIADEHGTPPPSRAKEREDNERDRG